MIFLQDDVRESLGTRALLGHLDIKIDDSKNAEEEEAEDGAEDGGDHNLRILDAQLGQKSRGKV